MKQLLTPEWDLSFPPYFVREKKIGFDNDVFDLSNVLGINVKAIYTPGHSLDSFTSYSRDTMPSNVAII